MPGRAVFVIALVACALIGCSGTGGKSATPTPTLRSEGPTPMPPIYPGTTVSIPPPTSSSSSPSHPSTGPAGPGATTMPRDGTYRVGAEIQPGTYRSDGGEYCYWERLRGLG